MTAFIGQKSWARRSSSNSPESWFEPRLLSTAIGQRRVLTPGDTSGRLTRETFGPSRELARSHARTSCQGTFGLEGSGSFAPGNRLRALIIRVEVSIDWPSVDSEAPIFEVSGRNPWLPTAWTTVLLTSSNQYNQTKGSSFPHLFNYFTFFD